nr:protein lingerer isoform X1 [Helicoverpa armigera]XP_049705963.1 protein lingerer isoform X1 [Helicoverpa armigera]
MSLGARATKGGAKGGAKDGKHAQDTRKSTDKTQTKEKVKPQATTEQLRMAHMIDRKSDDASDVRRMVLELMEMTCRTEEEVCSALHDSDNDMVAACNLLLEESQRIQGEWRTSEKKKKKPPAPAGNGELDPPRDPRSRSGPRPRRGSGERGGERGERGEGGWRGRGGTRGRGGARGARGGGARRPRPERACWDHTQPGGGSNNIVDTFPTTEDWDNEEWSGSLSDTKVLQVFTPSSAAQPADAAPDAPPTQEWEATEANGPLEAHIPTYTYHNSAHIPAHPHHPLRDQISSVSRQSPVSGAVAAPAEPQPPADTYHHPVHHQPMGMSGSLTAAQSQYLSQLTQQSQRHDNSVYTSNYGVYGNTDITSQRKPQRARVPPPSKIPSMAVEMPGGGEGGMFLDVQFGALEPDALRDNCTPKPQQQQPAPAPTASAAPAAAPASPAAATPPHEPPADTPPAPMPYQPPSTALSESLAVVEPTPVSAPATTEPTVTNTTSSLEAALSSMKQLSVSDAPPPQHQPQHHRPKTVGQQNVYAHHAVSHHPPVYGANVYAPQQVNSTNASLTGASAMSASAYPSSVTLTQYQPIINSYQTSSSAGPYGGSALYTAAPYTPYQPTAQPKQPPKETQQQQYDSSVASSNSLTSTTTQTQTSTAKVATTTVAGHGSGYAGGALYGAAATPAYAPYDDQLMRSTLPHHMGGYYEVGYGGRDATFGLSAGERFGRTDAASPQQVPAAALPPGYAYFAYQPPPTTYQYGVYPTYGGGSNVGGVGGVGGVSTQGKVSTYTQQQPYDAQDSYKPGGGYTGSGSKAGGGAAAELGNAIYAKPHPALNKVNSYEKASFHSGTPPPFGGASHLYIPAPPHHHPHHHAPQQHQMDVRVNSSHNRRESGAGGGRAAASKPAASKPSYSQSYWAPN